MEKDAFFYFRDADLTRASFGVWLDRLCLRTRHLTFHQEIGDALAPRD
jgi:hypothetical protein